MPAQDRTQADVLIGIDAGTSVIKAAAFTRTGEQIAVASTPNRILTGADGAAEQDMAQTWLDTAATLRQLAAIVPNLAARTLALAVAAQGDGTWLVDAQGQPVGHGMLWLDARSAAQVRALRASAHYAKLVEHTGTALNPAMQSGQLLWLRQHHPERLARATKALHCKDWLYLRLTGLWHVDPCESVFTFGNWRTRSYDDDVLRLLDLQDCTRLMPSLVQEDYGTAPLSADAAAVCGLLAGTPVALPLLDAPATILGSGGIAYVDDSSDASGNAALHRVGCSILGSTGMHGWVSARAADIVPTPQAGYTMLMPLPGVQARLMSHMAATLNINWLLGWMDEVLQLGDAGSASCSRAELLQHLNRLALDAPPGQAIFHPYVAESGERGPFVNSDARASLSGFSSRLGLAGTARAVFEGVCLAARHCYAALGELPAEIRLSGGAARSPALRQLLASVTARPVRVSHREECGAAGAALCAAVACGIYPNVRAALPDWVERWLDDDTTPPDAQHTALYDSLFDIYHQTSEQAPPLWQALAQTRRRFTP